jgi:hypothetical protein
MPQLLLVACNSRRPSCHLVVLVVVLERIAGISLVKIDIDILTLGRKG